MRRNSRPIWPNLKTALVLSLGGMSLLGCTVPEDLSVEAYRNPAVTGGRTYRLMAQNPLQPPADAHWVQTSAFVRKALARRGLTEAEDPSAAEVWIEIGYDIGPLRRVIEERDEYQFQKENPMDLRPPIRNDRAMGADFAESVRRTQGVTSGSDLPDFGETRREIREVFEKRLSIAAREAPKVAQGGEPQELWRVVAAIEDERDSLDPALPMLARAACAAIGTNATARDGGRLRPSAEPVASTSAHP